MNRRTWIGIVIAIVAVVAGWMLLQPMGQQDDGAYPAPEADFGSVVTVSDARITLPARAGNPAAVHLEITNRGNSNLYLSEILVEHGGRAQLTDISRQTPKPSDNVEIAPGQTLRFGREGDQAILTNYDENVVPGAELTVELVFGNGESLSVPATVEMISGEADRGSSAEDG